MMMITWKIRISKNSTQKCINKISSTEKTNIYIFTNKETDQGRTKIENQIRKTKKKK